MTARDGEKTGEPGPAEGARRATAAGPGERGRFSSGRKTDAVLRLLRGETLETLLRELKVTAGTLSSWRGEFLAGGKAALKSRPEDGRDEQIRRLEKKLVESIMDNEVLQEGQRILKARAEGFTMRKSKPERLHVDFRAPGLRCAPRLQTLG